MTTYKKLCIRTYSIAKLGNNFEELFGKVCESLNHLSFKVETCNISEQTQQYYSPN